MFEGIKRRHAGIDEDAKSEKRRAADPVLAMDQDPLTLPKATAHEGDAAVQPFDPQGVHVRCREMKESYSEFVKMLLVVAVLFAKVDNRANGVGADQLRRALHREAASDRQMFREPVKIRLPWAT
jgi:hypothetical protein